MITNDTELSLYKVTSMWDVEHYIIATDFLELSQDLIETKIEPDKIEMIDICFLNNLLLNKIKNV